MLEVPIFPWMGKNRPDSNYNFLILKNYDLVAAFQHPCFQRHSAHPWASLTGTPPPQISAIVTDPITKPAKIQQFLDILAIGSGKVVEIWWKFIA